MEWGKEVVARGARVHNLKMWMCRCTPIIAAPVGIISLDDYRARRAASDESATEGQKTTIA